MNILRISSIVSLSAFILLSLGYSSTAVGSDNISGAEKKVRKTLQAYVDGRQAGDLKAVQAVLDPQVDQLTSRGEWRRGRKAATAGMKRSSSRNPGARSLNVETVRFLTPDVALADARYTIAGLDGPDRVLWSSFTLVRNSEGLWRITSIRNQEPAE